ncbi:hypothetical protein [Paenibacillus durus]|nr:hypothetical protein [Paenibacillus durus]
MRKLSGGEFTQARYSLTQAAKLTTNPKVLDDIAAVTLSALDH